MQSTKKFLIKLKPTNSSARSMALLASGTIMAQAIPILITPILTRLYSPEEFGLASLYLAIASIVSVIATARYESAITLPNKDGDAALIAIFTIKLCFAFSVALYVPIIFFGEKISNALNAGELSSWLYFVPLSVLATGVFNSSQYWYNRTMQYKKMASDRVQSAGLVAASKFLFGMMQVKGGMIIGSATSQLLLAFMILRGLLSRSPSNFKVNDFKSEIIQAKCYIEYPKHIAPAHLLGVMAQQIPQFMMQNLFGLSTLGFFSMALRLVTLPTGLIANAIGDLYLQKISVAFNQRGEFRDIYFRTLGATVIASLIPFILLYLTLPFIFEILLGSNWAVAGQYAQILIVASFFQFIFTPLDKGALVVRASKYILFFNLSRLFFIAGLFGWAGYTSMDIEYILWTFVFINSILYIIEGIMGYIYSAGKL